MEIAIGARSTGPSRAPHGTPVEFGAVEFALSPLVAQALLPAAPRLFSARRVEKSRVARTPLAAETNNAGKSAGAAD